jgi:hypothetical protein
MNILGELLDVMYNTWLPLLVTFCFQTSSTSRLAFFNGVIHQLDPLSHVINYPFQVMASCLLAGYVCVWSSYLVLYFLPSDYLVLFNAMLVLSTIGLAMKSLVGIFSSANPQPTLIRMVLEDMTGASVKSVVSRLQRPRL